ncbi:hypothetical protein [Kitasatospora purpeofusca]|uniref:Uncharacterized protein n=1 Tax=Kitasatospora purpeofusca TaxID=67352 RepID=A0ABZ1TW67_9ACTN|nr:hypothetical protein [Kitasatospora purpeofusca]
MRNHITPAALGLAMLLAGAPWQTGNWGGGLAAALLTALVAHWVSKVPGLVKRAVQGPSGAAAPAAAPAPVNAYDRDRAEVPTRRRNRRNRAGR